MATDKRRPLGDEVPEADAQEQERDWVEGSDSDEGGDESPEIPPDAPAADVLDQHREVDLDEDESPH